MHGDDRGTERTARSPGDIAGGVPQRLEVIDTGEDYEQRLRSRTRHRPGPPRRGE